MKAILVRIGIDQAYGGWNAPVDTRTRCFVYVPIPDGPGKSYVRGNARQYGEIIAPLSEFGQKFGVTDLRCPTSLVKRNMHLDPDFAHLTYGDNGVRRGTGIAALGRDDLLVFYAGLRSIFHPRGLVYAVVGLFVIDEIVPAMDVPVGRRHENAHTRWATVSEVDIIVRGRRGVSGRLDRCIPIGEWRDGGYRVRREVEDAWGGLAVRNGYIQRSAVPPRFVDARGFNRWFRRQGVALLDRNN